MAWLVTAIRSTLGQLALVYLMTFTVGAAGLTHSIAGSAEALRARAGGGHFARRVSTVVAGSHLRKHRRRRVHSERAQLRPGRRLRKRCTEGETTLWKTSTPALGWSGDRYGPSLRITAAEAIQLVQDMRATAKVAVSGRSSLADQDAEPPDLSYAQRRKTCYVANKPWRPVVRLPKVPSSTRSDALPCTAYHLRDDIDGETSDSSEVLNRSAWGTIGLTKYRGTAAVPTAPATQTETRKGGPTHDYRRSEHP